MAYPKVVSYLQPCSIYTLMTSLYYLPSAFFFFLLRYRQYPPHWPGMPEGGGTSDRVNRHRLLKKYEIGFYNPIILNENGEQRELYAHVVSPRPPSTSNLINNSF